MCSSNSVLKYLKDDLCIIVQSDAEYQQNHWDLHMWKLTISIYFCSEVCVSESKFRKSETGWSQKSPWRIYAKSPMFHSTLPWPILLNNSNCHLYLHLAEITMIRVRTIWERLKQISLPFSVQEQEKPFCSDGWSSLKSNIICSSYTK